MKKMVLTFGMLLMLIVVIPANAAIVPGTWTFTPDTTNPDLLGGTWKEWFDGGGPGQAGAILEGESVTSQWAFTGTMTSNASGNGSGTEDIYLDGVSLTAVSYNEYISPYTINLSLVEQGSLWGQAQTVTMSGENLSRSYDVSVYEVLQFTLEASGVANGHVYSLKAVWGPDAPSQYAATTEHPNGGHGNSSLIIPFQSLELEITPVPIPAGLLLVGSGLLGLLGIRRRIAA